MCTFARARSLSHGREHVGVHAQFRRNKRELSRRREKHQKTRRAQSDGAAQARGAKKGRERVRRAGGEGARWPKEGARSEGRKKRDPVGTKGETDKGEREEAVCEKHTERTEEERKRKTLPWQVRGGGRRRRTARVGREVAGDGRRRMYIKILFSDEIPGGARRHTQRARVYF